MKNILVTGGAGFIGSHLIDSLLKKNLNVICLDNLSNSNKSYVKKLSKNKKFNFIKINLENLNKLEKVFLKYNISLVYHLAANSDIKLGRKNLLLDKNNTFISTLNILICMKKYKVKKIVFASSSAIYGDNNKAIKENSGPLLPISMYGAAKLASEAYISSFCENYDMKSWIIRFPNVVGWRMTHGVIFDLLNKLEKNKKVLQVLGDGNQTKPYVYVIDLIEAIQFIVKKTNNKINYFNVSTNSKTNVKTIVREILNISDNHTTKVKYSKKKYGWIGDVPKFEYVIKKYMKLKPKPMLSSLESIKKSIQLELNFRNNLLD